MHDPNSDQPNVTPMGAADRPGQKHQLFRLIATFAALLMVSTALAPAADAQVDSQRPTKPGLSTGLYPSASSDSVTVRWSPSTDNVGVTGYRVRLGSRSVIVNANATEYTFLDVAPGRYITRVTARDGAGNESVARAARSRVMTPFQQRQALNSARAIADALEAFIADGNDFSDLGGYNDRGFGWWALSTASGTYTKMSDTLINGGYLDPDRATGLYYDFMIYQCGSGEDEYAGVFSFVNSDSAPANAGPNTWTGCTNVPFRQGHLHYVTTETVGAIASDSVPPTRPGWPTGPFTESSSSAVTVRWAASTDNIGVAGYRVTLGNQQAIVDANDLSHTFTGVGPGRFTTRVYAFDAAGNESNFRFNRIRVMSDGQQGIAVNRTQAIADAIEAFVADGNDFDDLGGYNNLGRGWWDLSNASSYPTKMSDTLINGGYLSPVHDDGPPYDFMVYQCGTGQNEFAGVFSYINSDTAPAPGGPNSWAGCTTAPFKNAHPYHVTTETIGNLQAPATVQTVEIRLTETFDDVEERQFDGRITATSSDLEFGSEQVGGSPVAQIVGLRFPNVPIPQDATITDAWIAFQVDENDSSPTALTIKGEDRGDAAPFANVAFNLSSRTPTTAEAAWNPEPWSVDSPARTTPSVTGIVQEIVNRSDWSANNAMVFSISGSGERTAESVNGDASGAPLLHVEYTTGDAPDPTPTPQPTGANLLFSSGFEGSTQIVDSEDGYLRIVGQDGDFIWEDTFPADGSERGLWGSYNNGLHPINDQGIINELQTVTGLDGTTTTALYQAIPGFNGSGDTPQTPFQINNIGEDPDEYYVSYEMKIDNTSLLVDDRYRIVWQFKSDRFSEQLPGAGYRNSVYIYNNDNDVYWVVKGDDIRDDRSGTDDYWSVSDRTTPVPREEWFRVEIYTKVSDGPDGEFWVRINGVEIASHSGKNLAGDGDTVDFMMLWQLYGDSWPEHQWVDNVQIWDGYPFDENS